MHGRRSKRIQAAVEAATVKAATVKATAAKATAVKATPVKATASPRAGASARAAALDGDPMRVIAQIRTYNAETGKYGKYKPIYLKKCHKGKKGGYDCWCYPLVRGGTICFFPQFLQQTECEKLRMELLNEDVNIFRQYTIQNGNEPRLHVLVSCDEQADMNIPESLVSYNYHGVKMVANAHISQFPELQQASRRSKTICKNNKNISTKKVTWNQGADIIFYRNGNDKIGYHADDTQDEEVIFCAVVEAHQAEKVRPLHIKSKLAPPSAANGYTKERLVDGDVELRILADEGDAYAMDGMYVCISNCPCIGRG